MRLLLAIGVALLLVAMPLTVSGESSQSDSQSLAIAAPSPQTVAAGENFTLPLVAQGGFPPYTWSRVAGDLPPGLKLQPHKGAISGVPTTPGEYHFTVAVADSTVPDPMQVQRDLTIIVVAGLVLDWKQPPGVHGDTISGSAVVSNQTAHALDVTVIIVAVNKIGRATALGYQHFNLAAQASSPEIPFGSSPGMGTYYVRADVAAHRKSGHHIFRASKQTSDSLHISQL